MLSVSVSSLVIFLLQSIELLRGLSFIVFALLFLVCRDVCYAAYSLVRPDYWLRSLWTVDSLCAGDEPKVQRDGYHPRRSL